MGDASLEKRIGSSSGNYVEGMLILYVGIDLFLFLNILQYLLCNLKLRLSC